MARLPSWPKGSWCFHMSDELLEVFGKFVDYAKVLAEPAPGNSMLRSGAEVALPRFVEELEKRNEFHQLVVKTRDVFSGDYHKKSSEQNWHYHVHNFFCQSGYYLDLMHGKGVNKEACLSAYSASFQKRETGIAYFAPLELVSFAQDLIDFGPFKVRRFSIKEWDSILRNSINRVFYPYAGIDEDALELLSRYWFVCIETMSPVEQIGLFYLPHGPSTTLLFGGYAERWYTKYPKQVESAICLLSLFDWSGLEKESKGGLSSKENWRSLRLFKVPFVLDVKSDLLSAPVAAPDLSKLITESVFDPEMAEEVGKVPEHWISLGSGETEVFKTFIQDLVRIVGGLRINEYNWRFMEVALGYFTKAFVTDPGLEQMLWYITCLEALLGEKGAGVTRRLAQRIGTIFGTSSKERDKYSKKFVRLYELRNSLVHGAEFAKTAQVADILDAYLVARRAILWFLYILDIVQSRTGKGQMNRNVPGREELLMFLDFNRSSRNQLQWLLNEFPDGFPDVVKSSMEYRYSLLQK